jgi:hypothetical protein
VCVFAVHMCRGWEVRREGCGREGPTKACGRGGENCGDGVSITLYDDHNICPLLCLAPRSGIAL